MNDHNQDDDHFEPDDDDLGDDDADEVMSCPLCYKPVHEDTQQCPHCGEWIIPVEPTSGKRLVLIFAILLMVALVLLFIVR
ncbi:MAG: hypothetical protein AABZ47_16400 [Planctomycetota bacterium]